MTLYFCGPIILCKVIFFSLLKVTGAVIVVDVVVVDVVVVVVVSVVFFPNNLENNPPELTVVFVVGPGTAGPGVDEHLEKVKVQRLI